MIAKPLLYGASLRVIMVNAVFMLPQISAEERDTPPEPRPDVSQLHKKSDAGSVKATENPNNEETEDRFYPDCIRESYQGKDKQLRLTYGVKDEQGFYEIANIAPSSYKVTIVHSDDSRHHYLVEGFSQTKRYFFNPAKYIKTWLFNEFTSPEVLDRKTVGSFCFGWRTFEAHKQFRIHNKGAENSRITFYSDLEGPETAQTIEIPPQAASKWLDYKGGSIITNY